MGRFVGAVVLSFTSCCVRWAHIFGFCATSHRFDLSGRLSYLFFVSQVLSITTTATSLTVLTSFSSPTPYPSPPRRRNARAAMAASPGLASIQSTPCPSPSRSASRSSAAGDSFLPHEQSDSSRRCSTDLPPWSPQSMYGFYQDQKSHELGLQTALCTG